MCIRDRPNPVYLAAYVAYLKGLPHLQHGFTVAASLDDLEDATALSAIDLPEEQSVDLALGMHMIYFATDLAASVARIVRFVKPGGAFFSVVADEATAFGGCMLRAFIEAGGDTGNNDGLLAAIEERLRLLAPDEEGGGGLTEVLRAAGADVEMSAVRQPSRLYGHSLADLLAMANIGSLVNVPGVRKFEVAAKTLRDRPEEIDLRVETEGPRIGMWSVAQPQWVTQVRRIG